MQRFPQNEVLRKFKITTRQLKSWETQGLCRVADEYDFLDMSKLRVLSDMKRARVATDTVRRGVLAMQVHGVSEPLVEATAVCAGGGRMAFRHSGAMFDPLRNQFMFDFGLPKEREGAFEHKGQGAVARDSAISRMFIDAVALEGRSDRVEEAMSAYRAILEIHPGHAASSINLGTMHYNQRNFVEAERLYRQATETDPNYALAFFDLGNVLDELRRLPEAVIAYQRAIQLVAAYADAHYNLALTFERMGHPRRALRHWKQYLRLDASGAWASHARGQVARIMQGESLQVVYRRGGLVERTA